MKSWILSGLLVIGIVYMVVAIGTLFMEKPYDLDYELIRPSQPWEQLIWYVKTEGP